MQKNKNIQPGQEKQDFIVKKECNKFAHEFRSTKCPERDFNLQRAAVRPS